MSQLDAGNDVEHIYTSASETGYEPIDHAAHSKETYNTEDLIDNQAYGGVGAKSESTGQEAQYDAVVQCKSNESYTPVPESPVLFDGEYAYTAFPPKSANT